MIYECTGESGFQIYNNDHEGIYFISILKEWKKEKSNGILVKILKVKNFHYINNIF